MERRLSRCDCLTAAQSTWISYHLPDITSLGAAKVILDAGKYNGNVLRDGSFLMYGFGAPLQLLTDFAVISPDVPAGTYILSVVSHDYVFDQVKSGGSLCSVLTNNSGSCV
jgi:hypothetical protein